MPVEKPDFYHSREKFDFGKGFYLTPLKDQAISWSDVLSELGDKALFLVMKAMKTLWKRIYEF
jgi:hypothetical protein